MPAVCARRARRSCVTRHRHAISHGLEPGIPVADLPGGDAQVASDVLPAGRYAMPPYEGVRHGVAAKRKLDEWITQQQEVAVSHGSVMVNYPRHITKHS